MRGQALPAIVVILQNVITRFENDARNKRFVVDVQDAMSEVISRLEHSGYPDIRGVRFSQTMTGLVDT